MHGRPGFSAPTINKHARILGIQLSKRPGQSLVVDQDPAAVADALGHLTAEDLQRLVESMGLGTAAQALRVTMDDLRERAKVLGVAITARGNLPRSPRQVALEGRIRELEHDHSALAEVREQVRLAAETLAPSPTPPPVKISPRKAGPRKATPVDVVLHVSDLQYGEVVHGDDVPGGHYSPAVFADVRLPRWLDAVGELLHVAADSAPIHRLWLLQGGDFAEGHGVFQGQDWHLAMDPGTQVCTLAPLWAEAVARTFRTAKALGAQHGAVVSVVGNHGVPGGKKAGGSALPAAYNWDHLTYDMARHILAGKADGGGLDYYQEYAHRAMYLDVQGHVCLLTHGEQHRGGGLIGVPVVTGLRNDLRVRQQTGLNHRYHLMGHQHVPTSTTVGGDSQMLWNGDWCGANNLSTGQGGGSEPTQRCYVLHPEYGIQLEWPVRLAPGSARTPPPVLSLDAP